MLWPLEDTPVRPDQSNYLTTTLICCFLIGNLTCGQARAANLTPSAHPASAAASGHKSASKFGGLADYYHHSLYGKKTASGQVLQKDLLTAAHRTLPFGTRVHVVNKRTGKSCVVVINDRGPYTKSKVIDVSHAAATRLGIIQAGSGDVACTVLQADEDLPGHKAINQDPAQTEEN